MKNKGFSLNLKVVRVGAGLICCGRLFQCSIITKLCFHMFSLGMVNRSLPNDLRVFILTDSILMMCCGPEPLRGGIWTAINLPSWEEWLWMTGSDILGDGWLYVINNFNIMLNQNSHRAINFLCHPVCALSLNRINRGKQTRVTRNTASRDQHQLINGLVLLIAGQEYISVAHIVPNTSRVHTSKPGQELRIHSR